MGKRQNKYLGKSVKDIGKKGLDTIEEVKGIAKGILRDYAKGKISYQTAMSRMNLLELVVSRDKDFEGKKEKKARSIVDKSRNKLKACKKNRKKCLTTKTTKKKTKRKRTTKTTRRKNK